MDREWNDSQPIYRQLRDRVVAMILDGVLKEGDPLPSVRNVAAEYRVNPLTVLKGYQELVDEELVEKCIEIIRQEKRASTSLLQRRLRLGYTRAARIVDILEQRGILGPGEGAKPREILVDLDAAV